MVGYFEIVLLLLTVSLLLIRPLAWRLACSVPAAVFASATHEMFLLVFLPVLLLSFPLQGFTGGGPGKRKTFAVAAATLLLSVSLATSVRLALKPPMTAAQLQRMRGHIAGIANFPTDDAMYWVLLRSTRDNVHIMHDVVARAPWWRQQLVSLITMAPTVALLLLMTRRVLRSSTHAVPSWLFPCAVVASLSPLAMHGLGFDVARFNAMVILTSFLTLLTVCRLVEGKPVRLSPRLHHAVLLVVLLNMTSGDLLMDGRTVRSFPYIRELPQTLALRHGHWQPPDIHYRPRF